MIKSRKQSEVSELATHTKSRMIRNDSTPVSLMSIHHYYDWTPALIFRLTSMFEKSQMWMDLMLGQQHEKRKWGQRWRGSSAETWWLPQGWMNNAGPAAAAQWPHAASQLHLALAWYSSSSKGCSARPPNICVQLCFEHQEDAMSSAFSFRISHSCATLFYSRCIIQNHLCEEKWRFVLFCLCDHKLNMCGCQPVWQKRGNCGKHF